MPETVRTPTYAEIANDSIKAAQALSDSKRARDETKARLNREQIRYESCVRDFKKAQAALARVNRETLEAHNA